ncbi:IscS subfamily cysteine desulfurase [Gracilibacillus kekensis]|uniref:Cysteine desulfurase n=1 Tax=Gracilibacillus kekensis TaxID=1027249 RepID=A0A1M7NYU1_9BACI|nr:IscS subfamily cysteine desulfurase [Gracilibacillus kekensis]SHN08996.1 cysteine desulfurase [Gracilibacillus kekensis]
MVYCDYAATTPMSDIALEVYQDVAKNFFGNASSLHDTGGKAMDILDQARAILADIFHTQPRQIVFTSGGTESNLLAVDSLLRASPIKEKKHIITSEAEHSSLYYYFQELSKSEDIEVTFLPLGVDGQIDIEELLQTVQPHTSLVSIQHVSGETGVIQPIADIGKKLKEQDIYFHSDAIQSFGKIDLEPILPHVDCLTISSHKIFGPKGVGAIYFHPQVTLLPHPVITNHEHGLRPGTVDVPAIASFSASALQQKQQISHNKKHLTYIRELFCEKLKNLEVPLRPITSPAQCPSIVGCIADFVQGDYVMLEYNRNGIDISTGSACSIGYTNIPRSISPFISDREEGNRYIRFSFSHLTTEQDISQIVEISNRIFVRMKEERTNYEKKINW